MKDPRAETIQEVDGILSYEGLPTYSELAEGLRLLLGTAATAEAAKGEQAADALLARVFVGQHPQAEQRVTPGGGLPGDHNGTKQAAQVAECKKPFFAWDGDNGRQDFATQAEALAYAQETIGYYRRDARTDGVWPDEVEGVIVGVVTHATVRDGSEEDGFDYRLAPAQEATR